jgi:hypothetical protein
MRWTHCLAHIGGVAERLKAPVLKTGRGLVSLAGSNPAPTVFDRREPRVLWGFWRACRGVGIAREIDIASHDRNGDLERDGINHQAKRHDAGSDLPFGQ